MDHGVEIAPGYIVILDERSHRPRGGKGATASVLSADIFPVYTSEIPVLARPRQSQVRSSECQTFHVGPRALGVGLIVCVCGGHGAKWRSVLTARLCETLRSFSSVCVK
eukprot:6441677-Amphidinium_carterae.1